MTFARGRRWHFALTVTAMCALCTLSRAAFADEPASETTSSLSWVRLPGAEDCITGRELGQRVERRLGRRVFQSTAQAELAIEGRVEQLPNRRGYRVTISATRADGANAGVRTLTASRCEALDDEIVLVMALMIDPTATEVDRGESPAPRTDAAPTPVVHERIVEVPGPERPARPWQGHVLAGAGLAVGIVPSPGPIFAVTAGLDSPSGVGFALDGALLLPVRETSGDGRVDVYAMTAGLFGCYTFGGASAVNLAACVGPRVGYVHAAPGGFVGATAHTEPLVDLGARLRVLWRPTRLVAVGLHLGPELSFLRHCFEASDFDATALTATRPTIACTGRAGAVGWLGVGVALP